MKKLLKNKFSKIVLFLIIASISSSFILSTPEIFQNPNTDIYGENEDGRNPIKSEPLFVSAEKEIIAGTQDDPPFDENDIKTDDGVFDSTSFVVGDPQEIIKDTVATPQIIPDPITCIWGTTNLGPFLWSDAYKDKDGEYLYIWASLGWFFINLDPDEYPGNIGMLWGQYSDIPVNIHPHVSSIEIDYGVMADTFPDGFRSQSHSFAIWAYTDDLTYDFDIVASTPVDGKYEEGTWIINSGPVFDRVKAGGYIKYMGLSMYCNEELLTYTWLNVDYVDIKYQYDVYKVFFIYDLDFSGYNLGSITQFDVNIDLEETVLFTGLYLWDYTTVSWDFIDFVGPLTTFPKKYSITSEADHYFNATDHMRVAISRFGYYDARPYTDYQIKVDLLRIDIPPPDPPPIVLVNQGIQHILLTWTPSISYGAPILQYNVYRGTTQGGIKTLIGTPISPVFNDTDAGNYIGTEFFYVVSATSTLGEGGNSTEVSGEAYDQPFIEWLSPDEGATVIFPYNETDISFEWITFYFEYDWTELSDVELIIEGQNFGSVWGKNSVRLYPYTGLLDGPVNATLIGTKTMGGTTNDTREFTFVRTLFEVEEMLDVGQDTIGQQLYLILHDPNGDESYSGFNETTTLSVGVSHEITTTGAEHIELGINFDLFDLGAGGSTLVSENESEEVGFDFRFEVSDPTSLTSNQDSIDPAFIGPGYGDTYWGETWIFSWVVNATWRVFSDGNMRYEEPKIYYGIIREAETLVSDANAPQNWRDENPVYDNWEDVVWHETLYCDEDKVYKDNYMVSDTLNQSQSFQFQIDPSVAASLGIGTEINITETRRNYAETALAHTYEASYHIYDNEPGDWIVQEIGIDKRFGTYIFNTSSLCQTSEPYEHNTNDYVSPVIENPVIDYDSNGDTQGPCYDDSPIVTVELSDEDGIQEASIIYSIDNGTSWSSVALSEQVANPGTWEGAIPAQAENTTVIWYIIAKDYFNNNATRKDLNTGLPFIYQVIKKYVELPEEAAIPGYSIALILPITIVAAGAIAIIYHRKFKKIKK